MPKPATEYKSIGSCAADHASYITTALAQFRAVEIDFSQYQIVYIVAAKTPEDPKYDGVLANSPTLSNGQNIPTNNGVVKHVVTFGRDAYWRSFRVLVHETGHLFGLPDLYLFHPTEQKPHLGPAGVWDIMCVLDGGRHFLGWHRYKLDWLDESQLVYFNSGELTLSLTTMETAQGIKLIVLPSEYSSQLYVVEVAQELGEDGTFRDKGIVLYAVDGAVGTGHKPLEVIHCGAAVDDTNIGLRCGDFLAPGESHVIALANASRVEISNNRKAEDGFEVTVRVTGSQLGASVKPVNCSHCGRPMRG
ncbi:MAG: hypothetical protein EXR70_18275 [Deltaproteobacteria bacterium]|nr:hypothetical protein [Deltaproteobacteria bacterium]